MTEGLLRRLATLTSVKRTRAYDQRRDERNGDPGRNTRIAAAVANVEADVEKLKTELELP